MAETGDAVVSMRINLMPAGRSEQDESGSGSATGEHDDRSLIHEASRAAVIGPAFMPGCAFQQELFDPRLRGFSALGFSRRHNKG